MIQSLIILLAVVALVELGYVFMKSRGILSFSVTPLRTGLYFVLGSAALVVAYPDTILTLLSDKNETSIFYFLLFVLGVCPLIVAIGRSYVGAQRVTHTTHYLDSTHLTFDYIFSKFFASFFESVAISVLVVVLALHVESVLALSFAVMLCMMVAASYLYFHTHNRQVSKLLVVYGFLGALYPTLLLLPGGFYVATATHLAVSVALGVILRN
jgi:hypothetical protein